MVQYFVAQRNISWELLQEGLANGPLQKTDSSAVSSASMQSLFDAPLDGSTLHERHPLNKSYRMMVLHALVLSNRRLKYLDNVRACSGGLWRFVLICGPHFCLCRFRCLLLRIRTAGNHTGRASRVLSLQGIF